MSQGQDPLTNYLSGLAQMGGLAQHYGRSPSGAHVEAATHCYECGAALQLRQSKGLFKFDQLTGEPVMIKTCVNPSCKLACKHEYRLSIKRTCRCCGDVR